LDGEQTLFFLGAVTAALVEGLLECFHWSLFFLTRLLSSDCECSLNESESLIKSCSWTEGIYQKLGTLKWSPLALGILKIHLKIPLYFSLFLHFLLALLHLETLRLGVEEAVHQSSGLMRISLELSWNFGENTSWEREKCSDRAIMR